MVELLAGAECALTALEIDRPLESVGRASVYRTLDQLEQLQLIQRVEVGGDAAGYERVDPGGPPPSPRLRASAAGSPPSPARSWRGRSRRSAERSDFAVASHDVVLRGTLPRAARRRTDA